MANEGGSSHGRLTVYIVGAIIAAIVLALAAPHWAVRFEVGGEIFLRVLQMIVVPLVMASVMSGILGLGDVRKLGRPGAVACELLHVHHGAGRFDRGCSSSTSLIPARISIPAL